MRRFKAQAARKRRRKPRKGVVLFDLSDVTHEQVRDCMWVRYGKCQRCGRGLNISRNALHDRRAIEAAADYHLFRCTA